MARSIRFIHSGDIHLGAPFRGLRELSASWADKLADAIPCAFERLVDTCIERDVDFLLLAGDIFDTDTVSYAHYQRFITALDKLNTQGISVYMCAGNHDPYANWVPLFPDLPPCVHFFSSDEPGYAVYEKDGEPLAHICSRGFSNIDTQSDIAYGITRTRAIEKTHTHAPFAIGMLHTGFTIDARKAPCSQATLDASDMDYWAFGHIHQMLLFTPDDPRIAYCGCIQGRDVKETGPRGCLEVTLTEHEKPQVKPIWLASVVWEHITVDVSSAYSIHEVINMCINALFDTNRSSACEEMIARLSLEGACSLHTQLANPAIREEIRAAINEGVPTFYCDSLRDNTTNPRYIDAHKNNCLFESLIASHADAMLENTDETVEMLYSQCVQRGLSEPHALKASLCEYVRHAQTRALDALGDTAHD